GDARAADGRPHGGDRGRPGAGPGAGRDGDAAAADGPAEVAVVSTDIATLATLDVAALVAWGKERLDAAGSGLEVQKVKATAAAVAAYQRAVGAGKEAQQGAVEITVRC